MRPIDKLSVKFAQAGLIKSGEKYQTPTNPVPIADLWVEQLPGPFISSSDAKLTISGLSVNFLTRSVEGVINMQESDMSRLNSMLSQILNLHDALRKAKSITFMTGFELE